MTSRTAEKLIQVNAWLLGIWEILTSQSARSPRGSTMTGKRVVHIVDDDAAVRRALVRLLRSEGLEAVTYETAQAVLNAAPGLSSGCILLDVQTPGMNGLELLARLGELAIELPVIVVNGHGDV